MLTKLQFAVQARRQPSMNVLRVAAAVKETETVTINGVVFEADTNNSITSGRVRVDLSAGGATAASKVFTLATNMADGDTMVIDGTTFTTKTTPSATVAGDVLIGLDLTATRNNLVAAATGGAGAGTLYGSLSVALANVLCTATSTDALTATARVKGTGGNSIAISEAGTHASWAGGATALSGGVDPTAAEYTTALALAIGTSSCGFAAERISANEIAIYHANGLNVAAAVAEGLTGSGNQWAAATCFGGQGTSDGNLPITQANSRVPTATEVLTGTMHFRFGFDVTAATIQVVVTSGGAQKAWAGTKTISGRRVTLTNNASTDFAATDTVTVVASN